MKSAVRVRLQAAGLCLAVLFGLGLWQPLAAGAGGMVQYQAGSLSGYPGKPGAKASPPNVWQDQKGTRYLAAPPAESWQTPWIEEKKNEDRSWNMLDNLILDVSPHPRRSKQPVPVSPSAPASK